MTYSPINLASLETVGHRSCFGCTWPALPPWQNAMFVCFFCFGPEGFACFSLHTSKTTLLPVLLAGKPLWASLWSLITVRSDWWRIYRAVTLRVCKWILGLLRGRACQPPLAGAGAGTPASTRSRQTDKPANESENQNQEEAQGGQKSIRENQWRALSKLVDDS